jgi:acyl-CoA thioester hydrolase
MAPFVHRLRVRYGECDPQGWVFNAHYLGYFDVTLTELWRAAFGSYNLMLERGVDMVVAEATLLYRSPARFDEEVDIAVAVEHLGTTSLSTRFALSADGRDVLDGAMRHVFIDPAAGGKVPIPDWVRAGLAPYAQ